MASIILNKSALTHNYNYLNELFEEHDIDWAPVVKLLCGNKKFLEVVLQLGEFQVCDSRLSNLKSVKSLAPNRETTYIKPVPRSSVKNVVRYADVSFNTETSIIELLNEEAQRQGKIHRILIMVELGDLREGVMYESLTEFYSKVFSLSNIEVVGIGANLNCLNGIMPSKDKLIQLSLYAQLIEAKFNTKLRAVSGGTSVTLPLLFKHQIPKGINHFRVGETLFNGRNLFTGETHHPMRDDILTLEAEIIDITNKPKIPYGEIGTTPSGDVRSFDDAPDTTHRRAILDIGLLDIGDVGYIHLIDTDLSLIDGSSDMVVVDLENAKRQYRVGDKVQFRLEYMGALRVMNSQYIEKVVV